MEEEKEQLIEYRKRISEMKKSGKISECFYHDHTKCNGDIKQSHSIQRNGRLSIIEGDVNGQQVVYTFTQFSSDKNYSHKTLIPIGKGIASTFFGFCDTHDTNIFSPIENSSFIDNDKHCFLHSYRAYAHSYHKQKEALKALETGSSYTGAMPKSVLDDLIEGKKIGVAEGEITKARLNKILDDETYDDLEYLVHIVDEKHPIACSSGISPIYSYKNKPMNNHLDPNVPFSDIMLTVLPDHDKTIIILACFPEDKNSIMLFDELESLYPLKFRKAISSILVNNAENTFFAPALWNALGDKNQRQLCDELSFAASPFTMPTIFSHSKINFFDEKFSAKRLDI